MVDVGVFGVDTELVFGRITLESTTSLSTTHSCVVEPSPSCICSAGGGEGGGAEGGVEGGSKGGGEGGGGDGGGEGGVPGDVVQ